MVLPPYLRFAPLCAVSAGGCVAVFATVYTLEYGLGLEPCPLCMLQRVPLLGLLLLSAAGGILAGWLGTVGRRLLAGTCCALVGAGLGLAGRHLWLQQLPPDQVPACGPGLEVLFDILPPFEALRVILSGDGSCAEVQWSLLGLSIPALSAVVFVGFGALWLWQLLRG